MVMEGGTATRNAGREPFDVVDHFDGVGAGLPVDGQNDSARVVQPGADLVVFDIVKDAAELFEANGIAAVLVSDNHAGTARRW